jgi:aminoglycoside/choline kinase family phosphotransferase
MDSRIQQAKTWLEQLKLAPDFQLETASADASFRRYFRVILENQTLILMDAPPDKEPLDQFLYTHELLSQQQVHTPKIVAENQAQGFLLMEDLGTELYLDVLNHENADQLYSDAIDALINIQKGPTTTASSVNSSATASQTKPLPQYNESLVNQELELFIDWYVKKYLGKSLSEKEHLTWSKLKTLLNDNFKAQPQVWVHRDFHSRNLLRTKTQSPGVIDFQDMVEGPISYDLCSIFKDCYIEWPREKQLDWLNTFYDKSKHSQQFEFAQLVRWYDLTGLQRHIKVLGIFCRLNYRDGKSNYMDDLPLVHKYVMQVCDLYPKLDDFKALMHTIHEGKHD